MARAISSSESVPSSAPMLSRVEKPAALDAAPMFIDPVLEPGITGGVARGLAIEDDRASIGQDQPVPDQQHAALSEGDVCVIVADQARTLGDEQGAACRTVIDALRHLRRDLAR